MINAWLFWMSRKGALVSIPILLLIVGIIKVAYFVSVRPDPLIARKKPPEGTVKPAPPAAPPQYRPEFPSREIDTTGRYRGFPVFRSSTVMSNEILTSSGTGMMIGGGYFTTDFHFSTAHGNFMIPAKCVPIHLSVKQLHGYMGLVNNDPWVQELWEIYGKEAERYERMKRSEIERNVYGETIIDVPMWSPFKELPVLHDGKTWLRELYLEVKS